MDMDSVADSTPGVDTIDIVQPSVCVVVMTSADSWENAVALAVSVCVVLTAAAAAAAAAASPAASLNPSDTTVALTCPAPKAHARGAGPRSPATFGGGFVSPGARGQ